MKKASLFWSNTINVLLTPATLSLFWSRTSYVARARLLSCIDAFPRSRRLATSDRSPMAVGSLKQSSQLTHIKSMFDALMTLFGASALIISPLTLSLILLHTWFLGAIPQFTTSLVKGNGAGCLMHQWVIISLQLLSQQVRRSLLFRELMPSNRPTQSCLLSQPMGRLPLSTSFMILTATGNNLQSNMGLQ